MTPQVTVPSFVHNVAAQRVIFGSGTINSLPDEVARLGVRRAIVLATNNQDALAARVSDKLGSLCAAMFGDARMHTPIETTEAALEVVRRAKIDCTVAVGGGSTTGLGKAIAYRTDLPQLVLPTTYAGSEMTNILGETAGGEKKTVRDAKILPETVLYDVDLTLTLPPGFSVTSGINGIAHGVEALYAKDGNPLTSLMAEEGIRALASSLVDVARKPSDKNARGKALYGAWLCGTVLNATSMAIHHRLCHVLGGSFNLPHAETHTVLLPHAVAFNAQAVPEAMTRIARALDVPAAAAGLFDLALHAGAPTSLRQLGMPESGIEQVAELAAANPYWNPRPVTRDAVRQLVERAWHGRRPD